MCRALRVLCVAPDREALQRLKAATVSVEWELTPGAISPEEALRQLHEDRPHVVVVFGSFDDFLVRAVDAYPSLRVIADHEVPGASVVVSGTEEVREAVLGRQRPGPVR